VAAVTVKRCNTCRAVLPATPEFFDRDGSSWTGLTASCKTCRRARDSRRYNRTHDRVRHTASWPVVVS
jgi:hypothetical protein